MNLSELLRKIESYGFICEAGPLELCEDWIKLTEAVDKMPDPNLVDRVIEIFRSDAYRCRMNGGSDQLYQMAIASMEWVTGQESTAD